MEETIKTLDDPTAMRVLEAMIGPRIDAGEAPLEWSPELGQGISRQLDVSGDAPADSGELARQTLLLLYQDPQNREAITAIIKNPPPQRFAIGVVGGTILITAALFALQSHIEFGRDKDGQWYFKFKKEPTRDAILTPLIQKLLALISGGPPG